MEMSFFTVSGFNTIATNSSGFAGFTLDRGANLTSPVLPQIAPGALAL
jgi:hypothetical protein